MVDGQTIRQDQDKLPHHRVSVITPARNAADVIERVVGSVARQSVEALEHIVIDDGSTDDTLAIVRSLRSRFAGLQVIAQPKRGAAQARNAGIEVARGRYIAFLDADDEWLPDKLERQIGFMEETGTVFSYGDYWRCRGADEDRRKRVRGPATLTYSDLLRGCPIGCLTVAYNQEALGKVYMPDVPRGHDWGLWLSLTRSGETARRYPGVAAVYHVQSRSLSRNKLYKACDIYRIYREQEELGVVRSLVYLAEHGFRSVF
jgi:teichuronic acid biosynthesis glycosyltransferase TuaG